MFIDIVQIATFKYNLKNILIHKTSLIHCERQCWGSGTLFTRYRLLAPAPSKKGLAPGFRLLGAVFIISFNGSSSPTRVKSINFLMNT